MQQYEVTAEIKFYGECLTPAGAEHAFRKDVAEQCKKAFPERTVIIGNAKKVEAKSAKKIKVVDTVKDEAKKTPAKKVAKKAAKAKSTETVVEDRRKTKKVAAKAAKKAPKALKKAA